MPPLTQRLGHSAALGLMLAAFVAAHQAAAAADLPPVVRSARGGPWSAADTWEGGKVPAAGARVLIRAGHVVVYDRNSDEAIRSVHIAGALTFAPDRVSAAA